MRKINDAFEQIAATGNFEALDGVYTANARVFPPGSEMVSGRDNIKQFWNEAKAALGMKSVKLTTVETEAGSDYIIEVGRAELNGDATTAVKYVVVWKREDGAWKYHIDIWNALS
jgi:ketosteroid isomerase-like protein